MFFTRPPENTTPTEARNEPKDYATSFRVLRIVFAIAFCLLIGRFWYLQVVENEHYAQLAFNNFIKRRVIPAERGQIFDAKRRPVALNRPSYDVSLTPAFFTDAKEDPEVRDARLKKLATSLSLSDADTEKLIHRVINVKPADRFAPIPVKSGITRDQMALVETNSLELHGVEIIPNSTRYYPYNELASHLIGYVNQINDNELKKLNMFGYRLGDVTGRMGIERTYEPMLRGANGLQASVVNAKGMPQTDRDSVALMKNWKDVAPISGKNIILTIDMDLQAILKHALRNYETGSIVVVDVKTGKILGMASTPTFNPNSWSGRLSLQ